MPPFRFRFDSLLEIYRRQRDEAGQEVGKAVEAIRRVDEQVEQVQYQRDQLRQVTTESVGQTNVAVDRILHQGRYDLQLHADQVNLRQTRATLEEELARRRERLVSAEAEVKRLERLRETRQAEHRKLELQQEQAEADDLTAARFLMSRRKTSLHAGDSQT